ncbi:uncharacterized protein LOC143155329 [Ptiloglossa arizonensis]|uniref:uncharacterized protein LOC143155329 n=1 Tax=Ptiloglossa arizonensis TaxID=3350558 RepID=UPI003FA0612E
MSKDSKFFVRPKVRFCQTDAGKLKKEELKPSTDKKSTGQSNKPKIISVVTLDKPVILLKSNKISSKDQENKNVKSTNTAQKTESLTLCSNTFSPCTDQITSISNDNLVKTENLKPLSDVNNIQNIKINSEETDASSVSNKSSNNAVVISSVSPVAQNDVLNKVPKFQNCVKTKVLKRDGMKAKRGKENDALVAKKDIKNTTKRTSDLKVTHCKSKSCSTTSNERKSNVTSKPCTASVGSKKLNAKFIPTNVMPCHKYSKVASNIKTSSVKKTVIRDIIGPKIKPYIGPGVQRKKQNDFRIPKMNENACVKPCTSGEKLARPEYNSIMNTINKLNEIKKQKVVTDIEHLPATYKNLVNAKIFSALDFPLDEAVYKNLVDLSIDEKQLPSRLTRSKDPEPRQRDTVPVLSHFFTPVSTEEYCTPVSIKPRTPETIHSWSAFKISDKIFEWKDILDHV